MKTSFLKIIAIATLVTFSSCKDNVKEAETTEAEKAAVAQETAIRYLADVDQSKIEWKGSKPTGSHEGTINIAEGSIRMNDNTIESGNFAIDMKSITVTDIPAEEEGNASLKEHLSGPDFFDAGEFPMARFEVTGISTVDGKTMLSGNLTMKNVTNNVTFPVTIETRENKMKLTSETFAIDRTKWDVKYGSKTIFGDLGDKFINDDIELKVTLLATKS